MSLTYRLLYRLGFTPWERDEAPAELVAVAGELAPGRALDIGCGTGRDSVYLAREGWQVTALDDVPRALAAARARGARAGVDVDWRRQDVTRLRDSGLSAGYALLYDRGCYHGLSQAQRDDYAEGVRWLAGEGASLLLFSFGPGGPRVGPDGATREEIESRFADGWELVSAQPDSGPAPKGPFENVPRCWYRLRRVSRS
jgi:SAM-dependent methyltransferase